jgi:hypothetical protein
MAGQTPAYAVKQLSTPKVLVNGVVWLIKPNSCQVRVPGDFKVRAMSAGGGATQVVAGLNAESLIGHVKFEIAATAQNADRVRLLKEDAKRGIGATVTIVEDGIQFPHENMFMNKDTEIHMKADGDINIEFEGDLAA